MPVVAFDPYLVEFYDRVNSYWLYNATGNLDAVTVLSTGGGHRDIHVRDGLTLLDGVMFMFSHVYLSIIDISYTHKHASHFCNWHVIIIIIIIIIIIKEYFLSAVQLQKKLLEHFTEVKQLMTMSRMRVCE